VADAQDAPGSPPVFRLLDAAGTKSQSNTVAFPVEVAGSPPPASFALSGELRVLAGGEGGAFLFLDTARYGATGPAPHVPLWSQPDLPRAFAVGIDVHNPKSSDPFDAWGNVLGNPEREVSLHWDGRELVKRVAPTEFRGAFAPFAISVVHVAGGAEVTVELAGAKVYDREFVPGLDPARFRPAVGAGTRADAATEFDVRAPRWTVGAPAKRVRRPIRVDLFNHVLTDNKKTSFETTAELPPADWSFGRVLLELEIHDAGESWDEWDRCGELSVTDDQGEMRGIVPFITSYRTPCRWVVDVTAFRPWLAGKRRFEIAAGTNFYKNRGYMMSARLEFHHGTLAEEPARIVPLWTGTAHYRNDENHFRDFFQPQTVELAADTAAARIRTTTTGHSQVGEFTPSKRRIEIAAPGGPDAANAAGAPLPPAAPIASFENTLWKEDCYLNPNRPQYGTWKYPRAGWAPGDLVHPWTVDLTPHLAPHIANGRPLTLTYVPSPYDFSGETQKPTPAQVAEATHNIRSYLILYRRGGASRAAPTARITTLAPDGNAKKAGILEGDWLATYDGRPIESVEDLRSGIAAAGAAGKTEVEVVVFRGSEERKVKVPPGRLGVGLSVE
jgi:hypothetical protein